jgi:hypothetical protein
MTRHDNILLILNITNFIINMTALACSCKLLHSDLLLRLRFRKVDEILTVLTVACMNLRARFRKTGRYTNSPDPCVHEFTSKISKSGRDTNSPDRCVHEFTSKISKNWTRY